MHSQFLFRISLVSCLIPPFEDVPGGRGGHEHSFYEATSRPLMKPLQGLGRAANVFWSASFFEDGLGARFMPGFTL